LSPRLAQHPHLKQQLVQLNTYGDLLRHTAAGVFPGMIQPEPHNLTIAITSHCNLRCIGCRYGRDFMPNQQLSLSMIKDVLDDARQLGIPSVRLYGGEPLLHPDLPEMVEYGVTRGLRVYVTTNGILLRERMGDLYRAGLRDLTIGFYGTGAAYDEYVQRKNRFATLEASIAAVRAEYGMSVNLRLNWLLMRPSCSIASLTEAWQFAERYALPIQVDLIHYSLPYFSEGPDQVLQFRPEDRPAIDAVVTELLRLQRLSPHMLDHSVVGLRSILDWLLKRSEMRIPCDKYQMIWIGSDGTVQLCYVTFRLGNLHERRLAEMLFGPEHARAASDAFAVRCPNCHCSYDARIQKDLKSRIRYARAV
jgi:cyclic pyranopterin phosphate synthase